MVVFRHLLRDRGITVEDLLDPDPRLSKLKVTIFQFDPATQKSTAQLVAFLDEEDARLVAQLVVDRRMPPEWTDYKGGPRKEGGVEARVFSIRYDPKARKPYTLTVRRGAGELLPTGAVKPTRLVEEASIMLDELEATKMALAIQEVIRAFWASNYARLARTRRREAARARGGRAE